jgi:hypothetical protein
MGDFYLSGKKISTVFQLLTSLGSHENDMSRSVAWAFGQCPEFLREFVRHTTNTEIDTLSTSIRLQVVKKASGITDVEIESPGKVHIIVEAKRGMTLPTEAQLTKYAGRMSADRASTRCLVALTDCPVAYAKAHFRIAKLDGIPVLHVSWEQIADMARRANGRSRLKERYLLAELQNYLKGLITMQQIDSNWVFVLVLSSDTPEGWGISWIDIVEKKQKYFHPVGNNWPSVPPNYIAFRYRGILQSIHHIDSHQVVEDMHEAIPEVPTGEITGPHFVYHLGPAFRPDHKVPANIPRNGRRWCMLDTLFTSRSIAEANKLSGKRQEIARSS